MNQAIITRKRLQKNKVVEPLASLQRDNQSKEEIQKDIVKMEPDIH